MRRAWPLFAVLAAACAPLPPAEPDLSGPALELLYAQTARSIRDAGGLRTDTAPADAPITVGSLARNFEQIAFFAEYSRDRRGRTAQGRAFRLTRWEQPVRVGVIFGDSVTAAERRADLGEIQDLLARYRALTGLDIAYAPEGEVNFIVLVLEREEQKSLALSLARDSGFPSTLAQDLWTSRPSLLCSAMLFGTGRGQGIDVAVALIKAEHKGLMRRSCFHEELTQALGLLNDSDGVRPSIFNDDEEFALLTRHDEILLAMLYDDRLRLGMTADEARPLLPEVAAENAAKRGLPLIPEF